MKREDFIRSGMFDKLKEARRGGLTLNEICAKFGITYQNEYLRYLSPEQREEIKMAISLPRGKSKIDDSFRIRESAPAPKNFFEGVEQGEALKFGEKRMRGEETLTSEPKVRETVVSLPPEVIGDNRIYRVLQSPEPFEPDEPLFEAPGRIPFHNDRGGVVCRQQVQLAIQKVLGQLTEEAEYDRVLTRELNQLVSRGFVTREQAGSLRFCLEGLKLTLRRIP